MIPNLILAATSALLLAGSAPAEPAAGATGATRPSTLVLYDESGPWGWLGELYATAAGNLASHFGDWTARPVQQYRSSDLEGVRAVIYVGSTYDEPIPDAFLDDVLAEARPVIWVGGNLWKLARRSPAFADRYGFTPGGIERASVGEVRYKGVSLTRDPGQLNDIVEVRGVSAPIAQVLAVGVRRDGSTFPWAVRARNLTWLAENPFVSISESDRYLAFCDLLFDALAPGAPERHRAVVRIEDVHPRSSPSALKAITDVLAAEGVPFGVSVVPIYADPLRTWFGFLKVPERSRLKDSPSVVRALRDMLGRGGRLVMHGYTHQLGSQRNPYSGRTVDDFEFYRAHVTGDDRVVLDGPVEGDSQAWADARIAAGLDEIAAAGLPAPTMFEFPHYAASAADARAVAGRFAFAWQRGMYFGGSLTGAIDSRSERAIQQLFPFVVRDVHGLTLVPENIGDYQPRPYNQNGARDVGVILENARRAKVVRDGYAGVFFHSTFEPAVLRTVLRGLRQLGYTFVAPEPAEQPGRYVPATPVVTSR